MSRESTACLFFGLPRNSVTPPRPSRSTPARLWHIGLVMLVLQLPVCRFLAQPNAQPAWSRQTNPRSARGYTLDPVLPIRRRRVTVDTLFVKCLERLESLRSGKRVKLAEVLLVELCVCVGVRGCVYVRVHACVRACVRARVCVRACVRACVRVRVTNHAPYIATGMRLSHIGDYEQRANVSRSSFGVSKRGRATYLPVKDSRVLYHTLRLDTLWHVDEPLLHAPPSENLRRALIVLSSNLQYHRMLERFP